MRVYSIKRLETILGLFLSDLEAFLRNESDLAGCARLFSMKLYEKVLTSLNGHDTIHTEVEIQPTKKWEVKNHDC